MIGADQPLRVRDERTPVTTIELRERGLVAGTKPANEFRVDGARHGDRTVSAYRWQSASIVPLACDAPLGVTAFSLTLRFPT